MTSLRSWCALASMAAAGCTVAPHWPAPEVVASRLTGVSALIVMDRTGGSLDTPALMENQLHQADALRMALTTSPSIQAALARVHQAYAEAYQQRLLPNPLLSVVLKFPIHGGAPTAEPGISADLLALLQKPGKIKAAESRLRAASAEAVVVVLDTLAQAQECYARAQSLDAMMPVLRQRQQLTERLADIARSRLTAGEGTRLDVTTLEAQKIELEVEIAERELERQEGRLELARLIGQPSGTIEWQLDSWNAMNAEDTMVQAWIQAGLDHRPEITASIWELRALGVEFAQARWDGFEAMEVGAAGEGTVKSGARDWAIGPALTVPLPLFDWGQARRDLVGARRLEAAHLLNDKRRQIVEEIRRAHGAYRAAVDAHQRVSQELIPLLQQRRNEADSQYRAGQSDIISLILADQDLQAAQIRRIELECRTAISRARLHRAVGGSGVAVPKPATQPAPAVTIQQNNEGI
ncbi:MAG: TolC family protein [Phycisphaerales bacterium]|nr:TolC family protein [Phycisphaerales bacterium]